MLTCLYYHNDEYLPRPCVIPRLNFSVSNIIFFEFLHIYFFLNLCILRLNSILRSLSMVHLSDLGLVIVFHHLLLILLIKIGLINSKQEY